MGLPKAYAGKFLRVDLGSGETSLEDTGRLAERFLGGRGLATGIYHDEVPPGCRFDDQANRLIVSVGPLAGMPGGLGGSRWGIFGKSPLPAPGHGGRDHFCYGNLGGRFGAELRFCGLDGMVVQGKAEEPVCLFVEDDAVAIRPASDLWGASAVEARARMESRAAPGSKVMAIGPAGEKRVPLATVFADGDASCSGGMGAVMGAKGLKAVAVRGSRRRVEPADRESLQRIDRQIRSYKRGNVKVWGLDFMAHGPKTRKAVCFACMGHCPRVTYTADDGTRGKFMCQSRFFYLQHAWDHYGADSDVPFLAMRVCDAHGVDTWEIQSLIEWLLRCREAGLDLVRQSGLALDALGSLDFIEDLVGKVSRREGFGELLCLGAQGAARACGPEAEALLSRSDPYDPRYCTVNALLFPFETREPIQQLHEAGLVLSQWSSWAKSVPGAHISSQVARRIAKRFWGSELAADMSTLEGKAEAARRIQDRQLAKESVGLCDWMFPLIDVPRGEDHAGDPSFESRILTAALGAQFSEADLYRIGERVFNLQRAILLREGHRARSDDVLCSEWHSQPIDTHVADPELLAPGPGGRIVSQRGRRVELADFLRVRDEYYALRGWDVRSGLPSRQQLAALGLDDAAADLLARGLAVERARPASLSARVRHRLGAWRARLLRRPPPARPEERGPSIRGAALLEILSAEQAKFGCQAVRHNFEGWNKTMQYSFPDIGEHYLIVFADGRAAAPEKASGPVATAEICYEMDTRTLRALSAGELSGERAYLQGRLRLKASFGDMMRLRSLNKL